MRGGRNRALHKTGLLIHRCEHERGNLRIGNCHPRCIIFRVVKDKLGLAIVENGRGAADFKRTILDAGFCTDRDGASSPNLARLAFCKLKRDRIARQGQGLVSLIVVKVYADRHTILIVGSHRQGRTIKRRSTRRVDSAIRGVYPRRGCIFQPITVCRQRTL